MNKLAALALALCTVSPAAPRGIRGAQAFTESDHFTQIVMWSQEWSSICLMTGFWRTEEELGEPVRFVAETAGCTIRMAARVSLEEITYTLSQGNEVVISNGWVIISGNNMRVLEPCMPSQLDERTPMGFRGPDEIGVMQNGSKVERIELYGAVDWAWTEHDHPWLSPGFELWNGYAAPGAEIGRVFLPHEPSRAIVSSGLGTRLHACEMGPRAAQKGWIEWNGKNPDHRTE